MTTRKFNSLKKRLLEHNDLLALREIMNDIDAAEKINTDPELVAYIESQDNLVDLYDQILTDEEREAWHNALNNMMDLVAAFAPLADKTSNFLSGFAETLSKARFDLFAPSKIINGLSADVMREHMNAWKEVEPYLDEILKRPEYATLTPRQLLVETHTDENGNEYTLFQKVREEIEEKRAKKEQKPLTLPKLGAIPNGGVLAFMIAAINARKDEEGRIISSSRARSGKISTVRKGNTLEYIREKGDSKYIITISDANEYLKQSGKTFTKLFLFSLQNILAQNATNEVSFSLQDLVDAGMYSTTSNARRGVRAFFDQNRLQKITGIEKHGKEIIREEHGILFYHLSIKGGIVTLSIDQKFNLQFIAGYFSIFPKFAYRLKDNAFNLTWYIFYLARQNTKPIKEKGFFTISIDAIRDFLGLPTVEEAEKKNRKYRQYIIEPIEAAIEEIEEVARQEDIARDYNFTITPVGTDTTNIREYLAGYLEIGLDGAFADTYNRIAIKTAAKHHAIETKKNRRTLK